jgi:hypothetical protein
MGGFPSRSLLLPAWAVLAAGCLGSGGPPPDEATPGVLGRGEFFRWDVIDDPAEQTLEPLAVGGEAFVGYSSDGRVESLFPAIVESDSGRIVGRAPGTTLLAAFDARGRLVDYAALDVRTATDFYPVFRPVSLGWGWYDRPVGWDRPLAVPFDGFGDFVLVLRDSVGSLMGSGRYTAEAAPDGALLVEGYGRYLRLACLWSGPAQVTVREAATGAVHTLAVDCLDGPRPDGG